jgi:hypothetical protein
MCDQAQRTGHAISGYLATRDPTGKWVTGMGAIDVDTDLDDARAVRATLAAHGIASLLAHSRRGAHLWVWTMGDGTNGSERFMLVPAARVRRGLQAAVDLTIADAERRAHIEVFPKKAASLGGVGGLRMPLFRHPKTGTIYPVEDMDGHQTTHRLAAYNWTIPMDSPYNALYALGGATTTPVRWSGSYGPQTAPQRLPEGPGVVALLATMGLANAVPGRNVRCPFHEDRHASLSIAADDQRAWCKAPTCPAYNGGRGLGSLALAKVVRS